MQDNDIIMCDGHCNRAYHVKCLVPPVDPNTLPEDEGWLCPSCDRKVSGEKKKFILTLYDDLLMRCVHKILIYLCLNTLFNSLKLNFEKAFKFLKLAAVNLLLIYSFFLTFYRSI